MGSITFPTIDAGIAQFEGFNSPGTFAQVNNNPGNLQYGPFALNHGAIGSNGGFAVFPDAGTGLSATDALVGSYASQGYSLQDMLNAWAPPSAGNLNNAGYINYVSQNSGIAPTDAVSSAAKSGSAFDPYSLNSWLNRYQDIFGAANNIDKAFGGSGNIGLFGSIQNYVTQYASAGRIVAIILGILLVAGGVYLFKPVQEVINTTVKTAGEVAAVG